MAVTQSEVDENISNGQAKVLLHTRASAPFLNVGEQHVHILVRSPLLIKWCRCSCNPSLRILRQCQYQMKKYSGEENNSTTGIDNDGIAQK